MRALTLLCLCIWTPPIRRRARVPDWVCVCVMAFSNSHTLCARTVLIRFTQDDEGHGGRCADPRGARMHARVLRALRVLRACG